MSRTARRLAHLLRATREVSPIPLVLLLLLLLLLVIVIVPLTVLSMPRPLWWFEHEHD
jgi:hypothetical protein